MRENAAGWSWWLWGAISPPGLLGMGQGAISRNRNREYILWKQSYLSKSCGLWGPASWQWRCREINTPTLLSSFPWQARLKHGRCHECGPWGLAFWGRKQVESRSGEPNGKFQHNTLFPHCCWRISLPLANSCREMGQTYLHLQLLQSGNAISKQHFGYWISSQMSPNEPINRGLLLFYWEHVLRRVAWS